MRMIGRILGILMAGILSIVIFFLDLLTKIYAVIISWFYIVLAICAIAALVWKQWTSLAIFIGVFVLSVGLVLGMGLFIGFLDVLRKRFLF